MSSDSEEHQDVPSEEAGEEIIRTTPLSRVGQAALETAEAIIGRRVCTGPIQEETNLSRTLFQDPERQQGAEQPLPAPEEQEDPSTNTTQNQNMSATNTTLNLPMSLTI